MSENGTRAKASDTDLVLVALDQLHQMQEEQTTILQALEGRPIVEVAGLARRLEEVADSIERLQAPPRRERRRPWWLTPLLLTLAYVLGAASVWGSLWWLHTRQLAAVTAPKGAPAVTAPAVKKGK